MYACIYCEEDNSITVLKQSNQKLHLPEDGEFKLRQNVTFEWRKKSEVFSGIIVRIGDDEDKLTEWGTKAYKHILKPKPVNKDSTKSDIICQLINFSDVPQKLPPKRPKKQTEKAALSKEQEDELKQPQAKKQKTNFSVQRKLLTELKSQFQRDQRNSEKPGGSQTQATVKADHRQTKEIVKNVEQTHETVNDVGQAQVTEKDAWQSQKTVQDAEQKQEAVVDAGQIQQETSKDAGQTKDTSKDAGQTQQVVKDADQTQQENGNTAPNVHYEHSFWPTGVDQSDWSQNTFGTSLTQTWALCSGSNYQTGNARRNEPPVPPQEMIQFFRAMRQPHIQAYIDSFLHYYESMDNPDQLRTPGFGFMAEPLAIPTFHTLQSGLSGGGVNPGGSFGGIHTDTPLPTMESIENNVYVTPRRSPRKHFNTPQGSETPRPPKPSATIQSDSDPDKHKETPVSSTESIVDNVDVTPRRSPRKHFNTPQGSETPRPPRPSATMQSDSDPNKMRLLPEKDLVWVSRLQMRKATTAASKKKDNAGYVLMYNLLTCAFTVEELAESRGTGIGRAAPGFENRSVLDVNKIADLKEFVNRWTKKNMQRLFPDKDLNSAITERCSYCRVQLKRASR